MLSLPASWVSLLCAETQKEYFIELDKFVTHEYTTKTIFPPKDKIFYAFELLSPEDVKVVILGQDPYHGKAQGHGLAFSVSARTKIPPSLKNIYKELVDDMNCPEPRDGNLEKWAKEGVLLINSVLSVEEAKPNSHKGKGWEIFTDSVINKLSADFENIVFILWGGPSQKKEQLIDTSKHLILKAPHPSPLSSYRGFFGSKPFSQANAYLKKHKRQEIEWCLSGQQTLL